MPHDPGAGDVSQGRGSPSLTRRAALTFASQLLAQGASFIVGFVVTPIVVSGLGPALYGAWAMIQQSLGFVALGSLNAMGALKLSLGVTQHEPDLPAKRRLIGAAMIIWGLTLPLFVVLAALGSRFAPSFIRTEPEHLRAVRVAVAILIASVPLGQLLGLPGAVLRGQNIEYKAMGLNAAVIALGGALNAWVIWAGFGIEGLAVVSVVGLVLVGVTRYMVAQGALSWFGTAVPSLAEFIVFAKRSGWVTFMAVGGFLLTSTDLLLVGYLLAPSSAAVYAITGSALRMLAAPAGQLLASGNSGLAMLCGRGDWPKVETLRVEMHQTALLMLTVIGAGVLSLNQAFIGLWVGAGYYGGAPLNALLVASIIASWYYGMNLTLINSTLKLSAGAWPMLLAGLGGTGIGCLLCGRLGAPALALGSFSGYAALAVYYVFVLRRIAGLSIRFYVKSMLRPAAVSAICMAAALFVSPWTQPKSWPAMVAWSALVGLAAAAIMWFAGLSAAVRSSLWRRSSFLTRRAAG